MLSTLLTFLVVGLIAGALARFLVPGRDPMGIVPTILLGIVGAFVGGTLWSLISGGGFELEAGGIILAVVGAIIALLAYRAITARTSRT